MSVDPLAMLAPALGLVAAALLLLAGATPLARLAERLTARRRRLQPWFSVRQVSRGLTRYSAAILVIALAVGSLTLAASYSGTWSSLGERTELLRVGADQRLVLHEGRPALASMDPVLAEPYRELGEVDAAAPALVSTFLLSAGIDGVLTAIPATSLPSVMTDADGTVDVADTAERLPTCAPLGLPVPEGAGSVTLHGTLVAVAPNRDGPLAPRARVEGTVWLENADGALLASPFGPFELASGERFEVAATTRLPDAGGGWRVVAVDVGAVASIFWTADLRVTGFSAADASGVESALPFSGTGWTSQLALGGITSQGTVPTSTFRADGEGFTIGLSLRYGDRSSARAMAVSEAAPLAGKSSYAGTVNPLPIVISRSLAEAAFLEEGDDLEFRVPGTSSDVSAVVTGILPNIPGASSEPAILADLLSLNEYLLRTSELIPVAGQLWLATAGQPVDASAVTGPGVRSSSPGGSGSNAVTATAEVALWIAAIGCLALAILSLGAVVLAVSRARGTELAALRAEGLTASAQSRSRFAETAVVAAAAVAAGILAGGIVSWLTVPNLARSVVLDVPEGLAVPIEPALAPWAGILALLLLSLVAVAAAQAVSTARRTRAAVPGQESR